MDLNPVEPIWKRLKALADEWANSEQPLPDRDVSADEVRRIVHEVLGPHAEIAEGAVSFYADELLGFVQQYRALRVGVRIFGESKDAK